MEKDARLSLDNRVECTAATAGNHRPADCLSLYRRDAEVFHPRQDVCPASREQIRQVFVGHPAQEGDCGACQCLQRCPVPSIPGDDQRQPQLIEGPHRQVNPPVGDQAGDDEVVVVVGGGGAEA